MMTTSMIEEPVMAQYNVIHAIAAYAEGVEAIKKASQLLDFAVPMWEALGFQHIAARARAYIAERAADLIRANNEYIRKERKNNPTRRSSLQENRALHGYLLPSSTLSDLAAK